MLLSLALLSLATLLSLTACSSRVDVTAPTPTAADRDRCAALVTALPDQVVQASRRTVSAPTLTAAWGDPPITLRCGVPKPPSLTAASECAEVDGVGWYAQRAARGYVFTTIGRPVFVELAVPSHYAPEAGALTDVADAVRRFDPVQQPCR